MSAGHPDPSKLRPLTSSARAALRRILDGPVPCQELNSGVVDRLLRGSLVEAVDLPSPYKTKKGSVRHLRILDAGRLELEQEGTS